MTYNFSKNKHHFIESCIVYSLIEVVIVCQYVIYFNFKCIALNMAYVGNTA